MFSLELTENDKDWLQTRYPELSLTNKNGVLVVTGVFDFNAIYNDFRIADSYNIQIELKASEISAMPRVCETSSRIKKVAKTRKINLADLHTYDDGTACLCVKPAEVSYFPERFSFQIFVEQLIVPFFYAQSFFEQKGDWPWETYSHGRLGWLEWYFDQECASFTITKNFLLQLGAQRDWKGIRRDLLRKGGVKGHRACLCGSLESYTKCHPKAFKGLLKLAYDARALKLKV